MSVDFWRTHSRKVGVAERTDPDQLKDGISMTLRVLETLPPQDRSDEAIKATVEGMLRAATLLEQDDTEGAEP